ncbi:hypothetical protein PBCVNY2B_558R [Paramecium bursaria Chlorella virus NY2B]|uniref:Uncharacterized protein n=1 Tax=Paramecium bursaria Chlorella virus NYs1 TaxID=83442 RepID=M1I8D7_9PHYC|nr:hypothetical protein AR158_C492R [Paramecium bursaria Chlorella virus AR158]YP_009665429.1 hypothetical protein FK949_gp341 [Paramecium bursaria Chlorella virus NYs1]AGE54284.1 hypothetical protein PBCVIL52s1_576R [Paramecium bursaria Chlorella virus IL-5-2s1]AGE54925.1 hypothetical protein PBCVMA1D_443R [Paramecium bursaria Chlorella virus MA1D]AGE58400.1 hypothetical protein PBCVNY2B_558R [Paramecium bursaria Chlorella virus NY2B]ABU44037.1 hypothetical protein AR158_C492R [Paramecium bur
MSYITMDEATQIFKESVKEYVDIHNQLLEASRSLKEVRKKKDELGQVILDFMNKNDYEVCASGNMKLIKRESKRQSGLKEEIILDAIKEMFGDVDAHKLMDTISSKREVITKPVLSCRVQKSNKKT